jgi:hypothetical protein
MSVARLGEPSPSLYDVTKFRSPIFVDGSNGVVGQVPDLV